MTSNAILNGSGSSTATNSYDEFGIPGEDNVGRFQYTGQVWIPEIGMYYYKARMYSPTLGRFMQTDPIGYGDGLNIYNYVGGDPVNAVDPTGLKQECVYVAPGVNEYGEPAGPGGYFCSGGDFAGSAAAGAFVRSRAPRTNGLSGGGGGSSWTSELGDVLRDVGQCTLDQYGFGSEDDVGDIASGAARATSEALAAPIPKELAGVRRHPGTSPVTNPISYASHRTRIGATAKFRGRAGRVSNFLTGTARVASALGRANAVTGAILFLYDAGSIGYYAYQKSGE